MTSKAQAKRNKRAQAKDAPLDAPARIATTPTARPTDERLARGSWGKHDKANGCAFVDAACDMIGRLLVSRQISERQAQTARTFSECYADYKAEIGITESKSCIAVSSGGFDAGDGDPDVFKRYYAMRDKIGRIKLAMLQNECDKPADGVPYNVKALANALDCLGA